MLEVGDSKSRFEGDIEVKEFDLVLSVLGLFPVGLFQRETN